MSQHELLPGVIRASLQVLSMPRACSAELVAGAIPETVRWLRLPRRYAEQDLSGVLSPSSRLVL